MNTNTIDELLDLVDENDNVIGSVSRKESNEKGLAFREVAVLIYDDLNRILTQQRAKTKSHPLEWIISVAGHVTHGMSPLEVAHKELKEELGFDTDLVFVQKLKFVYKIKKHFVYLYIGRFPSFVKITLDPTESEAYRFVGREDLMTMEKAGEIIESSSKGTFNDFWDGKLKEKIDSKNFDTVNLKQ